MKSNLLNLVFVSAIISSYNLAKADEKDSTANRQDLKYSFYLEPVGLSVSPFNSMGLGAAYHLDSDQYIFSRYVTGSVDVNFLVKFSIETSYLNVGYKKFVSNSFYWQTGIGYRTISMKMGSIFGDKTFNIGQANSLGADVLIGNQWQFESFTIGCDWVGFFLPFSSTVTNQDSLSTSTGDSVNQKTKEDALKKISKANSTQLLRFYIGWAI